uniref:Uncharacterized protein n=1 Tax=Anguilla anguilla TaxID=7936 RepID=A0A0E9QFU4_ANGAN
MTGERVTPPHPRSSRSGNHAKGRHITGGIPRFEPTCLFSGGSHKHSFNILNYSCL